MELKNQTILITGGASGIGLGLAEAFKAMENTVIIAGRSLEKLKAVEARGFATLTVDMTSTKSIQAMAAEALAKFPALNGVIHNAGIMKNEKLSKGNSVDVATETLLTNVLGPMTLTQALLPHFLKQKSATIITVTSGLAFVPLAMTPTYCASKAAVHSYTESLRYQMKGTSVEVKEIVPPYVRTSLMGDRQANDPNAMPLEAFIAEVISLMKANPAADEIVVQNSRPFRDASFLGAAAYAELFAKRNDFFFTARKKEWDEL